MNPVRSFEGHLGVTWFQSFRIAETNPLGIYSSRLNYIPSYFQVNPFLNSITGRLLAQKGSFFGPVSSVICYHKTNIAFFSVLCKLRFSDERGVFTSADKIRSNRRIWFKLGCMM